MNSQEETRYTVYVDVQNTIDERDANATIDALEKLKTKSLKAKDALYDLQQQTGNTAFYLFYFRQILRSYNIAMANFGADNELAAEKIQMLGETIQGAVLTYIAVSAIFARESDRHIKEFMSSVNHVGSVITKFLEQNFGQKVIETLFKKAYGKGTDSVFDDIDNDLDSFVKSVSKTTDQAEEGIKVIEDFENSFKTLPNIINQTNQALEEFNHSQVTFTALSKSTGGTGGEKIPSTPASILGSKEYTDLINKLESAYKRAIALEVSYDRQASEITHVTEALGKQEEFQNNISKILSEIDTKVAKEYDSFRKIDSVVKNLSKKYTPEYQKNIEQMITALRSSNDKNLNLIADQVENLFASQYQLSEYINSKVSIPIYRKQVIAISDELEQVLAQIGKIQYAYDNMELFEPLQGVASRKKYTDPFTMLIREYQNYIDQIAEKIDDILSSGEKLDTLFTSKFKALGKSFTLEQLMPFDQEKFTKSIISLQEIEEATLGDIYEKMVDIINAESLTNFYKKIGINLTSEQANVLSNLLSLYTKSYSLQFKKEDIDTTMNILKGTVSDFKTTMISALEGIFEQILSARNTEKLQKKIDITQNISMQVEKIKGLKESLENLAETNLTNLRTDLNALQDNISQLFSVSQPLIQKGLFSTDMTESYKNFEKLAPALQDALKSYGQFGFYLDNIIKINKEFDTQISKISKSKYIPEAEQKSLINFFETSKNKNIDMIRSILDSRQQIAEFYNVVNQTYREFGRLIGSSTQFTTEQAQQINTISKQYKDIFDLFSKQEKHLLSKLLTLSDADLNRLGLTKVKLQETLDLIQKTKIKTVTIKPNQIIEDIQKVSQDIPSIDLINADKNEKELIKIKYDIINYAGNIGKIAEKEILKFKNQTQETMEDLGKINIFENIIPPNTTEKLEDIKEQIKVTQEQMQNIPINITTDDDMWKKYETQLLELANAMNLIYEQKTKITTLIPPNIKTVTEQELNDITKLIVNMQNTISTTMKQIDDLISQTGLSLTKIPFLQEARKELEKLYYEMDSTLKQIYTLPTTPQGKTNQLDDMSQDMDDFRKKVQEMTEDAENYVKKMQEGRDATEALDKAVNEFSPDDLTTALANLMKAVTEVGKSASPENIKAVEDAVSNLATALGTTADELGVKTGALRSGVILKNIGKYVAIAMVAVQVTMSLVNWTRRLSQAALDIVNNFAQINDAYTNLLKTENVFEYIGKYMDNVKKYGKEITNSLTEILLTGKDIESVFEELFNDVDKWGSKNQEAMVRSIKSIDKFSNKMIEINERMYVPLEGQADYWIETGKKIEVMWKDLSRYGYDYADQLKLIVDDIKTEYTNLQKAQSDYVNEKTIKDFNKAWGEAMNDYQTLLELNVEETIKKWREAGINTGKIIALAYHNIEKDTEQVIEDIFMNEELSEQEKEDLWNAYLLAIKKVYLEEALAHAENRYEAMEIEFKYYELCEKLEKMRQKMIEEHEESILESRRNYLAQYYMDMGNYAESWEEYWKNRQKELQEMGLNPEQFKDYEYKKYMDQIIEDRKQFYKDLAILEGDSWTEMQLNMQENLESWTKLGIARRDINRRIVADMIEDNNKYFEDLSFENGQLTDEQINDINKRYDEETKILKALGFTEQEIMDMRIQIVQKGNEKILELENKYLKEEAEKLYAERLEKEKEFQEQRAQIIEDQMSELSDKMKKMNDEIYEDTMGSFMFGLMDIMTQVGEVRNLIELLRQEGKDVSKEEVTLEQWTVLQIKKLVKEEAENFKDQIDEKIRKLEELRDQEIETAKALQSAMETYNIDKFKMDLDEYGQKLIDIYIEYRKNVKEYGEEFANLRKELDLSILAKQYEDEYKKRMENIAAINKEIDDKIYESSHTSVENRIKDLQKEANEYVKQGADIVKVTAYVAQQLEIIKEEETKKWIEEEQSKYRASVDLQTKIQDYLDKMSGKKVSKTQQAVKDAVSEAKGLIDEIMASSMSIEKKQEAINKIISSINVKPYLSGFYGNLKGLNLEAQQYVWDYVNTLLSIEKLAPKINITPEELITEKPVVETKRDLFKEYEDIANKLGEILDQLEKDTEDKINAINQKFIDSILNDEDIQTLVAKFDEAMKVITETVDWEKYGEDIGYQTGIGIIKGILDEIGINTENIDFNSIFKPKTESPSEETHPVPPPPYGGREAGGVEITNQSLGQLEKNTQKTIDVVNQEITDSVLDDNNIRILITKCEEVMKFIMEAIDLKQYGEDIGRETIINIIKGMLNEISIYAKEINLNPLFKSKISPTPIAPYEGNIYPTPIPNEIDNNKIISLNQSGEDIGREAIINIIEDILNKIGIYFKTIDFDKLITPYKEEKYLLPYKGDIHPSLIPNETGNSKITFLNQSDENIITQNRMEEMWKELIAMIKQWAEPMLDNIIKLDPLPAQNQIAEMEEKFTTVFEQWAKENKTRELPEYKYTAKLDEVGGRFADFSEHFKRMNFSNVFNAGYTEPLSNERFQMEILKYLYPPSEQFNKEHPNLPAEYWAGYITGYQPNLFGFDWDLINKFMDEYLKPFVTGEYKMPTQEEININNILDKVLDKISKEININFNFGDISGFTQEQLEKMLNTFISRAMRRINV